MQRILGLVCAAVFLLALAEASVAPRPVPQVTGAAKPPASQSRFPASKSGTGSASDSYLSSQLRPGGSLSVGGSMSAASQAALSGSSLPVPSSSSSLSSLSAESSDSEDSMEEGSQPEYTGSSCDGTFRCIGARTTRIVNSFHELDEADRRAPDEGDIRKDGFGPTSSSSSSGSSSGSSGSSSAPPTKASSMAEIGKAADQARCEAIIRALSAQRTIADLKNSLAAFSKASKYYASPQALLPASCRGSGSSSMGSSGTSSGSGSFSGSSGSGSTRGSVSYASAVSNSGSAPGSMRSFSSALGSSISAASPVMSSSSGSK